MVAHPKIYFILLISDFQPALSMYGRFLESEQAVKGEYDMWKKRWATKTEFPESPDTANETLVVCDIDFFPNISVLLHIRLPFPAQVQNAAFPH